MSLGVIQELGPVASVADETASWPYQHDRDLTGFIDGTENPTLVDAPDIALVPHGAPGEGGTILLLQKWRHDAHDMDRASGRAAGGGDRATTARRHRAGRQAR